MSWPIGAVDKLPYKVSATLDGTIMMGPAAVTEPHGWVNVGLNTTLRGWLRPIEVRVRVRLSVDAAARPFLYAEEVEFEGRRFAGLQSAATVLGQPAVAMIPPLVLARFTHFAVRRTDKHAPVSETRPVVREEPSRGADDTWQPGARRVGTNRSS